MPKNQSGFSAIYIVAGLLTVIVLVTGAYFLGSKNFFQTSPPPAGGPSPTLSPTPTPSPSVSPNPSPLGSPEPSAQAASPSPTMNPKLLENIKASVISKNTAALEGYMTDTVSVILEATECCGDLTKVNAIKQMDYLKDATLPWNFDDNNPIALALKQKNPAAFPDGIIIGTSADRKLITFTLNPQNSKIIKVYMAIDYKLLLP